MSTGPTWNVLDRVEDPGSSVYEDAIGTNGDLAWVIDGATSVTRERLTTAPSDARWLVDRMVRYLTRAAHDRRSLSHLVREMIERIHAEVQKWEVTPTVPPSAALGLVRTSRDRLEYLVIADVTIVVADGEQVTTIIDRSVDRVNRPALKRFERALRTTRSHSVAKREVEEMLISDRRNQMNRPGGYWVVSIDPTAADHALTGTVLKSDVCEVLLCTDGFARVVDVFGAVDSWTEFFASRVDLRSALREVRASERGDPECLAHLRWTVSDDASAILVAP